MRASMGLLALVLATVGRAGTLATVVTAEEATIRGELLGLLPTPAVQLSVDGKPRTIPCSDLLELRLRDAEPAVRAAAAMLSLRDGSIVRGTILGGGARAVNVQGAALGTVACPLGAIARIELPGTHRKASAAEASSKTDRLFLQSDEVVEGTVEAIEEGKVVFRAAGLGKVDVPFDRVRAIAFARDASAATEAPKGVVAIVHTDDGSVVSGRLTGMADGKVALETLFGPKLAIAAEDILRIEFRGGRLTYLSDLEPASVKETPFFDIVWRHRRDRSVDGNPLRLGGKSYRKGLGTHTRCELTYALDGGFRRLLADVGIDDEVGDKGSVDVQVLVDGKVRFERKGITGRDAPLRVQVDVTQARQLVLVADFGAGFDICDHLDWANARLIR
ncbi:MAG: NPCBM/NEW2 domain-containing protein [Candidatus Brocadiae bacterium]|nr:NPCBM/NEW2 domain-containing protein [Candidatus Brocadiia bacterium]